jgi:cytochrome c oxidase subunit 2
MLAFGGVVLAVVAIALYLALRGGPAARWIAERRTILIGGFAFPVVVLTGLLVYGLWTTARVQAEPEPAAAPTLRIRVVGEMWWWRVFYFEGDRLEFETANEIVIPVGRPVSVELASADVIHSFWVPQLAPKLDMIPGRLNALRMQADAPGRYRGQCTEFCGAAHALMAFEVVALTGEDFTAWRARASAPRTPDMNLEGRAVFERAGCGVCHAVRGDGFTGAVGPDLTHLRLRRTLAAGILINNPATLRAWIADADALKPGVRMPSYERLTDAEIDALARYLEEGA